MSRFMPLLIATMMGLALFADSYAQADVIYVPDDHSNLQAAMDAADSGDTIVMRDGTYTGADYRYMRLGEKELIIRSEHGPRHCIIDLDGAGRAFEIYQGQTSATIISGFTITGANAASAMGGAFLVSGGTSPIIRNCIMLNNSVHAGGGIAVTTGSSPTILNCLIVNNTAVNGGGVASNRSNPTLKNCLIIGNDCHDPLGYDADLGGGIYTIGSDNMTLINCIIRNNTASNGNQIALYGLVEPPSLSVSNSNIQGGQAGIHIDGSATVNWGSGNMTSDPLFVQGPGGNYYLSQIATGHLADSPCLDAGAGTAASLGLDSFTTRIDEVGDSGVADIGFHYSIPRIDLLSPSDLNYPLAAPTFEWTSLGGVDPVYAVDIAIPPILPLWSTYNNMHVLIRDEYWSLPSTIWDAIPSGARVYWRVRGADIGSPPPVIVSSNAVWSFFVYDSYPISDESHTLTDGIPVYLSNQNVAVGTVIITDSTGAITYELGVDYDLIVEGPQVRIDRVPGGTIANGQQVLVDYFYYDI